MHGVRAPNGGGRSFRQPEVAHLAGLDEIGHRADGVLDRHREIDAVLVVKIDGVNLQSLERGVARPSHVLRRSVDAVIRTILGPDVSELRRDDDGVAAAGDRTSNEPLVREGPVDVRGVEEIDPEIQRPMDRGDGFVLVTIGVEVGHPHAAKSEGRYFQAEIRAVEFS